jgi:hypothetical protein
MFRALFSVIPSMSEESNMDSSLRFAPFSMTGLGHHITEQDVPSTLFCSFQILNAQSDFILRNFV